MTGDKRDAEAAKALVAFLKALGVVILTFDNPRLGGPSAASFLWGLDQILGELATLPGGPEICGQVQILREMLGNYVDRARELEALRKAVDEIFRDLDS